MKLWTAKPVTLACAVLALALGLFAFVQGPARTQTADRAVLLAEINGAIGPAAASFVAEAIETAKERNAPALILQIDTPGGLATSMRDIIRDILASPVPVVGFVAPPGARAASAGTYILYATHVAAMAPGTNLGAATPVQIGGGGLPGMPKPDEQKDDKKTKEAEKEKEGEAKPNKDEDAIPADAMKLKTVNDAVAFIRSLAELRGRNADWAEAAVRKAESLSSRAAKKENVIDLVAADTPALLKALDGRTVTISGVERTLATKGLKVERLEPDFMTKLLGIIANPNVALILMMIGVYGLIFELASPGSIGPGVVGIICLVLGLYALNQLPLNYAGLALILVGMGMMVAEALSPSFGVLGTGGIVAFVLGAAMVIDTDVPAFQPSWTVILGMAAVSAAFLMLLLGYVWRSLRSPYVSGAAGMVGESAEILDWSGDTGHVWAAGERWSAHGPERKFRKGQTVRIEGIEGITLEVVPARQNEKPGEGKRSNKGD